MAFVIERELSEEDKKRFKSPSLYKGHGWGAYEIAPFRWVIDRERDVFLTVMGGNGPTFVEGLESSTEYAISIRGQVIKFDAFCRSNGEKNENKWVVNWYVDKVYLSEAQQVMKDEVYALIKEGLDAAGRPNFFRGGIIALNVVFKE